MARRKIRKTVILDEDTVNWFMRTFPNGSLSGTVNALLLSLRTRVNDAPKRYAQEAIDNFIVSNVGGDGKVTYRKATKRK